MRMYLDQKIRQAQGFVVMPYITVTKPGDREEIRFGRTLLKNDQGRLYVVLDDPEGQIPEELAPFAESFSWQSLFPRVAKREAGIYRYESAECELIPDTGDQRNYFLRATGPKIDECVELVRQIKFGTIRPTLSYEVAQGGQSHAELEIKFVEVQRDLEVAQARLAVLERKSWFERLCVWFSNNFGAGDGNDPQ